MLTRSFTLRNLLCTAAIALLPTFTNAQYCTPTFLFGCEYLGFEIDDINTFMVPGVSSTAINDLNTGCGVTTGYDDRTFLSVTFQQGGSYTASINSAQTDDNTQVWIDFNNDNTFSAGESIGGTNNIAQDPALTTFTLTIPASATVGTHRMRVIVNADDLYPSLNPCGSGLYAAGEVHDYTVVITSSSSTSCSPVTGLAASSITASGATISWTAVTGATGYEWAVTTSSTPPASGTGTTATTANATGLAASTSYYAHVRTNCGTSFSTWTTIPFTTLSTSACPPVTGLTAGSITASAATISWTAATGATGYEWAVTTSSTPPASGTATTLTTANATGLAASTGYYAHVRTNCGTSFSTWTSVPFTTLGTTTGCTAVSGLTASAITTTGATVSWTAVTSGSLGYQYVIDNIVTAPTGSGTNTTATTTSPTGLTPGTTYYAHVRDSCGVGNFSAWTTIPFTTLSTTGCNAVTGLAASPVGVTTATIHWTAATGAIGARYVVNTTATDPASGGTGTTAASVTVTGLTANTLYYAHVRDSCSATSLSAWVTVPFTTARLAVNNVPDATALVTAYPNPTTGMLTIKVAGTMSANATLQLTDVTGKVLLTTPAATENSVNMSDVPAGMYLIRYTDELHREVLKITRQ